MFLCFLGWVQIKCELRLLSRFSFNLNPEWELLNMAGARDDHKPLQVEKYFFPRPMEKYECFPFSLIFLAFHSNLLILIKEKRSSIFCISVILQKNCKYFYCRRVSETCSSLITFFLGTFESIFEFRCGAMTCIFFGRVTLDINHDEPWILPDLRRHLM